MRQMIQLRLYSAESREQFGENCELSSCTSARKRPLGLQYYICVYLFILSLNELQDGH